jgi:hypothetical protein
LISRKILAALLSLAAMSLLFASPKREKDPVFGRIDAIVKSLSSISGFSEEHPVPYGAISKKQLRRFLGRRMKKTLKPGEIRTDELTLKLFGLVPQGFDLKKSTLDLLTEQAAAFYDYDEKKLFLLEGSPLNDEVTTLAHELSHALADQHFDLGKFMEDSPTNDDEGLAHTAVVEGQASWLMVAYNLAESGRAPIPTAEMLKPVEDSGDSSAGDYPVLKASPLYIRQSLLFPYTEGTKFFDTIFRKLGKPAFAAVFTNAPVASSQILHPERYFANEKPSVPELPELEVGGEGDEVTAGSIGEFDQRMLLWQYLGETRASELAPHMRGAQFRVIALGKKGGPVLEYVSQWDSNKSASDYFTAYKKVLRGKWKRCEVSVDSGRAFAGRGDNGFFVTHVSSDILISVEGLSGATTWAGLKARMLRNPIGQGQDLGLKYKLVKREPRIN